MPRDLYLRVHSCPLRINDRRVLLLVLQDITAEQQAFATQAVFLHDVANTVMALGGVARAVPRRHDRDAASLAKDVLNLTRRLEMEIQLQRALADPAHFRYDRIIEDVPLSELMEEVTSVFSVHPAARDKRLICPTPVPGLVLRTDGALLLRVLANMLINAFEGTGEGGEVRLSIEQSPDAITFAVWNAQAMAPEVARRIFQRNFSTKATIGRGLGTYSMRLFAEQHLGGEVSFTTSPGEGTTFRLRVPTESGQ